MGASLLGQICLWTFLLGVSGFMIYWEYEQKAYCVQIQMLPIVKCLRWEHKIPYLWVCLAILDVLLGVFTIMNYPKLLVLDLTAREYRLTLVTGTYSVPLSQVIGIEAVDGCKAAIICQIKGAFTEMSGCGSKGVYIKTSAGYKD